MDPDFIWRDAKVTYPDWNGTAQLDQKRTDELLEEIIGLDRNEWMIVGIDIGGGESGLDLHVVAVHHTDIPAGSDVLSTIADLNGGEIPVTDFLIHNVEPFYLLRRIIHQFQLRLRVHGAGNHPFRVKALGDVPEQK
ncbi:hypothetical protein [Microbacterium sp. S1037]|uniref:hypothetical protein n=1 Tax=Microbacterium sp. S1037 TaxID=3398227 RepID=UPI003AB043E8